MGYKKRKYHSKWDKESCHKEALKYNTRSDFFKMSSGAYDFAHRNKHLDEICSHMKIQGSIYKRYNYIYEFPDNHVYIGLTYNIDLRHSQHLTMDKSTVFQYIKNTGLIPVLIYDELKEVNESQIKEINLIEEYKKNGWIILNKVKAGGLGMIKINWTKESCHIEALKYTSRLEFQKGCRSAYRFAIHNKIIDEVCSHMILKIKPKNYWTKERCKEESMKYKTRHEFRCNSESAYAKTRISGWLDDFFLKN